MPVRESGAKRSRTRRFMSAPPYAEGGEMQGGGGLCHGIVACEPDLWPTASAAIDRFAFPQLFGDNRTQIFKFGFEKIVLSPTGPTVGIDER